MVKTEEEVQITGREGSQRGGTDGRRRRRRYGAELQGVKANKRIR
jgi:hypothetical protein